MVLSNWLMKVLLQSKVKLTSQMLQTRIQTGPRQEWQKREPFFFTNICQGSLKYFTKEASLMPLHDNLNYYEQGARGIGARTEQIKQFLNQNNLILQQNMTKFSITRIPYPIIMSVFKLTSLSSFCYSFEFFKSMSDFEIFLTIKLRDAIKKQKNLGVLC